MRTAFSFAARSSLVGAALTETINVIVSNTTRDGCLIEQAAVLLLLLLRRTCLFDARRRGTTQSSCLCLSLLETLRRHTLYAEEGGSGARGIEGAAPKNLAVAYCSFRVRIQLDIFTKTLKVLESAERKC